MTSVHAYKTLKNRLDSNAMLYDQVTIDEITDKKQKSKILAEKS